MKRTYPIQAFAGLDISRSAHEIALNATPDCNAMWPIRGRLERIPGKQKYSSTQLAGDAILAQRVFIDGAGVRHQLAITNTKAYRLVTGSYTSIQDATDFSTTANDRIAACTHFDASGSEIFIISNLLDDMRKWTGSGTLQTLGGTPPKANLLLHYRGYLLAGRVIESGNADPRKVRFSALFNSESWPADNNFRLKTTTDWLVAMKMLRDRAVIYKENSISMLDYVGGGLVFDLTENYKTGIGPAGDDAVVRWGEQGERHFFIGYDTNIYEFDGIDDANISRRIEGILANITPSKKHLISGAVYPNEGKIIWAIPLGGKADCSDLLIFDVRDRSWWMKYDEPVAISSFGESLRESGFTWDTLPFESWDEWTQSGGWDSRNIQANVPELLAGCVDGYVRKFMLGTDDDGAAIASTYMTAFDNLDGSDETEKQISRIYIEIKCMGSGALTLQVYTDNNPQTPVFLDESGAMVKEVPLTARDLNKQYKTIGVDVVVSGSNFAVRLSSQDLNWSGKVTGFEYEIVGEKVFERELSISTLIGADGRPIVGADNINIEVAND